MKIIYRFSDGGNSKNKPVYVTKRGCLEHFLTVFKGYDIYVIADNVSEDTYHYLCTLLFPPKIIRTSLNNSYRHMLTSITLFSISYLVINNNCNNTNKNNNNGNNNNSNNRNKIKNKKYYYY
jgi:hypothetical protein